MTYNPCECMSWAGYGSESFGKHHHADCYKYHSEKFPYLLYYEEAVDSWVFAPDRIDEMLNVMDQLEDGEEIEVKFKRKDFTDNEMCQVFKQEVL